MPQCRVKNHASPPCNTSTRGACYYPASATAMVICFERLPRSEAITNVHLGFSSTFKSPCGIAAKHCDPLQHPPSEMLLFKAPEIPALSAVSILFRKTKVKLKRHPPCLCSDTDSEMHRSEALALKQNKPLQPRMPTLIC